MRLINIATALIATMALITVGVGPEGRLHIGKPAFSDGGDGDGGDGDGGDGDGGDGDGGDGDGGDGDGGDGDGGDGDGGDGDGGGGDGGDGDGGDGDGGGGDGEDGGGDDEGDDDDRDDDDRDDDDDGSPNRADADDEEGFGLIDAISDFFGGGDDSGGGRDVVEDEIVALGVPPLQPSDRVALADAGFRVIAENPLPGLGGAILRLALPLGIGPAEGVEIASNLVPDAIFDENNLYSPNEGNCTGPSCWGAEAVGLIRAPAPSCDRGAPIAIIDTPIDQSHPALRGAPITRRNFLPAGAKASDTDHGTAIAAILVGNLGPETLPLAPGARLLVAEAVQEIEGRALADTVALIRGLDWAISSRARIVTLSLAGSDNRALARAIRSVAGRINVVAAAGNGGPRAAPAYPAAYPEVLAVAAVDRRLRPYRKGNRGAYVSLAAPGVEVVSAGGSGTRNWTGTSFAVPYVAAALLRARALTQGDPVAARTLLETGARDLGAPGHDEVFGHGLVQSPGDRCW